MKENTKSALSPQVIENVTNVLRGKKVLFLENDNVLENGLDTFEQILKDNFIQYTVVFEVQERALADIFNFIQDHDALVFQTQWVYEISKQIKEFMFALLEKKIAIEVYINEPTFYYKPDVVHDVYIFSCLEPKWDEGKFYKLSSTPYWKYENKFDQ